MLWRQVFARVKVNHRSNYSRILVRVCAVAMATEFVKIIIIIVYSQLITHREQTKTNNNTLTTKMQ